MYIYIYIRSICIKSDHVTVRQTEGCGLGAHGGLFMAVTTKSEVCLAYIFTNVYATFDRTFKGVDSVHTEVCFMFMVVTYEAIWTHTRSVHATLDRTEARLRDAYGGTFVTVTSEEFLHIHKSTSCHGWWKSGISVLCGTVVRGVMRHSFTRPGVNSNLLCLKCLWYNNHLREFR